MPRSVVPIFASPAADSRAASTSRCQGRMTVARSEISRFSPISTPAARTASISVQESLEVEDDPRPDDADAAPDDPRGQQVEREVLVPELDRVPGVVAAVVPRHDLESVGEEVDELALALVAPLPAQDRQDLHVLLLAVVGKTAQTNRNPPACQPSGPGLESRQ